MANNKLQKFKSNSGVAKSKHFAEIMQKFNSFGKMLPMSKFWHEVVSALDPEITLRQWTFFYNKNLKDMAVQSIEFSREVSTKIKDDRREDESLEQSSLNKILKITDLTLDEVIDEPEKLAQIPISRRIDWLFKAMKARDSRMTVILKKKEEDRKETMFEELMKGAQYGSIEEAEIVDQEDLLDEPESLKAALPPAPEPQKEVKFDPTNL